MRKQTRYFLTAWVQDGERRWTWDLHTRFDSKPALIEAKAHHRKMALLHNVSVSFTVSEETWKTWDGQK